MSISRCHRINLEHSLLATLYLNICHFYIDILYIHTHIYIYIKYAVAPAFIPDKYISENFAISLYPKYCTLQIYYSLQNINCTLT